MLLINLLKWILSLVNKDATIESKKTEERILTGDPKWLVLGIKDVGFQEIGTNRGIDHFIKSAKTGSLGDPWCAIWINAKLEDSGVPGSRSAMARSFENHPNFRKLEGPARGAIGTMWRGSRSAGTGHVFFYAGHDAQGRTIGLAGNQGDGVKYASQDTSRIVGYYWPKNQPAPVVGRVAIDGDYQISKEV
jgi:TIGR02594 family protein